MKCTVGKTVTRLALLLLWCCCAAGQPSGYAATHSFTVVQRGPDAISMEYRAENPDFENGLRQAIDSLPDNQSIELPGGFKHRTIVELPEKTTARLEVLRVQETSFPAETAAFLRKNACRYRVAAPRPEGQPVTMTQGYLRDKRVAVVEVAPLLFSAGAQPAACAGRILFRIVLTAEAPGRLPLRIAPRAAAEGGADEELLKITVSQKGICKVTHADVQAAGITTAGLDPAAFQLTNQGKTVAILLEGEQDHSFDAGDYFVFYGQPVESDMTHEKADNKFLLDNVYWLDFSGSDPARIKAVQSLSPAAQATRSFTATVREQQDTFARSDHIDSYFWCNFPDYEDAERSDPAEKSFTIRLPGLDASAEAVLRVRFKGENNTTVDPDHRLRISVNDAFQSEGSFDSFAYYVFEATLPAGVMRNGDNTITIQSIATAEDLVRLDWIEVAYQRDFTADSDELAFSLSGGRQTVTLQDFTGPSILLFNVTDPWNAQQITGYSQGQAGTGYTATFTAQSDGAASYYAAAANALQSPEAVAAARPSAITSSENGADYLIVTHEDFYDAVQTLASYRRGQGYRVATVTTGEIYDAFNYGIMHPQAIRDFLEYAFHSWTPPAPRYVLLVGDGNSDATDRLGTGNKNFLPILLDTLGPQGARGAHDTWYGQVNGSDILSDVLIGRLPVKTPDQLAALTERIIAYEAAPKSRWLRNAFFVAGDDPYFVLINEQLSKSSLPANYTASFFNRGESSNIDAVLDTINNGTAMTVYCGHGNVTSWNGIMDTSKFTGLQPNGKPTLLVTLNCYNGHFASPAHEGFSEEFLRHEGGSICCVTPVSTGYPYEHKAIAAAFFDILFNDSGATIGEAFEGGKLRAYLDGFISAEAYQQYIILGDPATRFNRCEFHLISPDNREAVARGTQFSWKADGFSRFKIQFSPDPAFPTGKTLSLITPGSSYTPGPLAWSLIGLMAGSNPVLWWRIAGIDRNITVSSDWVLYFDRKEYFTEARSFTMQ